MRQMLIHILFALMYVGFCCTGLFAQDTQDKPEAYSAVAVGTGGVAGGKTMQFDFRIKKYASDEEIDQYAELLKTKGPDALRSAFEKLDAGQISPVGRVGNQIAVARKQKVGSDTQITIVTARIMPFIEL